MDDSFVAGHAVPVRGVRERPFALESERHAPEAHPARRYGPVWAFPWDDPIVKSTFIHGRSSRRNTLGT